MKENNNLKLFIFFVIILYANSLISQNSLLEEIDYKNENYKVGLSTFKAQTEFQSDRSTLALEHAC